MPPRSRAAVGGGVGAAWTLGDGAPEATRATPLEPSHAVMGLTGHRVTPTRKDGHPEVEAASWLPRVSGPVSRVVFSSIQSIELM